MASFWTLVRHFGKPDVVLGASIKEVELVPGIGKKQLMGFSKVEDTYISCTQQLERLGDIGGQCLTLSHEDYPVILKEISDPPPVLYVLGDSTTFNTTLIAMVGSRASTSYGGRIAFKLAKNLAHSGVTVVSGVALGIDSESHRGALAGGGKTVGVLGSGIDVVYPRQNYELFDQIANCGAIMSEYPLGTAPEGFHFPARNRIIAGMSRGVVVVEAAKKSGSLITAQLALDEGREVYAVPGQVDSYKSEGTHWLLKQGAKLVQSENDVLEDLAIIADTSTAVAAKSEVDNTDTLEPEAQQLLQLLDGYPLPRENLLQKSGLPVARLSELLLLLELDGFIEVLPGDEICRRM